MKISRKILSCVLAFSMMLSCIGISAYAAPVDDLTMENFSLVLTEGEGTINIALNCNKVVNGWGAGAGIMSVKDASGADASSYFVLKSITTTIGDVNNAENLAKWSATANTTQGGDTLSAGTWTTYVYELNDLIPAGTYTFTMSFSNGDNYDGTSDMTDYTVSGKNLTTNYIVEMSGEDPTPTTESYTADLGLPTGASNAVKVNDPVSVTVLVGGTTKEFASSELNLTYTGLTYIDYTVAKDDGQISVEGNDGAIKIIDHGESSTWSDNGNVTAYTLNFTVNSIDGASGTATVTLSNAALSSDENASGQNLTPATITTETQTFTVTPADLTVTLPDGLTSTGTGNIVSYNGTFEFEATDKHYNYTLSAKDTVGTDVTVSEIEDGKWKIQNVTSNIMVTVTNKVGKTYTITFSNKDHILDQTTDSASFVYGTDGGFSFTLKDNVPASTTAGTTYAVDSIKYTGTENNVEHTAPGTDATTNRTYFIPTASITGNITITTSAETVNPKQFTITLPTSTYPELTVDKTVVDKDGSVVLTLDPVAGYKYTVSVNGNAIPDDSWTETDATDDDKLTYTITNITANVTVTVTKEVDTSKFDVEIKNNYVAMDGKTVHLVRVSATLDSGYDCTYDGAKMYWSTGYAEAGEYVYLVITDANTSLSEDDAKAKIGLTTEGKLNTIAYNGNVNLADASTIDANDAQLVWNMYQAKSYSEFATEATGATMEKFLRADVDKNGVIETQDASEIILTVKTRTN